jgi:ABC-2 type transport system ATP-binding protein
MMEIHMSFDLEVDDLKKSYGDFTAVNHISFRIRRGEIFGILGPNGAGKTTTLQCILGTRKKERGEISILGKDPLKDRKRLFAEVGIQFQESAWQPNIRVSELCKSMSSLYNPSPLWKQLLEDWELKPNAKVESLSGGEKQKLSILLATFHNPRILFLDEITTGLDPLARRMVWERIEAINRKGCTIAMTSHFMDEVERLCQNVLVLQKGRIIAAGTVEDIKKMGSSDDLESAYINLIEGETK